MNIVILGAGNVGKTIAEMLCQHEHAVTVIDKDPDVVRRVNEELDVRAILGSASQSSVLFQAGIISADVCLAVTGNDETNICLLYTSPSPRDQRGSRMPSSA